MKVVERQFPGWTELRVFLVQYVLGEMHPTRALMPQPGDPDRGASLFWLSVMSTAGYVTSSRVGHPERFARDDRAIAQVKEQGDKDFAAFFRLMEAAGWPACERMLCARSVMTTVVASGSCASPGAIS